MKDIKKQTELQSVDPLCTIGKCYMREEYFCIIADYSKRPEDQEFIVDVNLFPTFIAARDWLVKWEKDNVMQGQA